MHSTGTMRSTTPRPEIHPSQAHSDARRRKVTTDRSTTRRSNRATEQPSKHHPPIAYAFPNIIPAAIVPSFLPRILFVSTSPEPDPPSFSDDRFYEDRDLHFSCPTWRSRFAQVQKFISAIISQTQRTRFLFPSFLRQTQCTPSRLCFFFSSIPLSLTHTQEKQIPPNLPPVCLPPLCSPH